MQGDSVCRPCLSVQLAEAAPLGLSLHRSEYVGVALVPRPGVQQEDAPQVGPRLSCQGRELPHLLGRGLLSTRQWGPSVEEIVKVRERRGFFEIKPIQSKWLSS